MTAPDRFDTDVLIIGAGPAGTIAAAHLLECGRSCIVVERARFPRFAIGESLIPRCNDCLDAVGMLDLVRAAGFDEKPGATFVDGERVRHFDFSVQKVAGHSSTWHVDRARFDALLAKEVEKRGASLRFETSVTALDFDDAGAAVTVESPAGTSVVRARFVVDASGFANLVPRLLNLVAEPPRPDRGALYVHYGSDGECPVRGHVWIHHLERGVWAWALPLGERVSVGVVGDLERVIPPPGADLDAHLRALVAHDPWLSARIADAETVRDPIFMSAYQSDSVRRLGERWVAIGNSPEFVDPVLSSGVMLAMESAALAMPCVDHALDGADVDWSRRYLEPLRAGTQVFAALVDAWYEGELQPLLFAEDAPAPMRKALATVLAGYVWDDELALVNDTRREIARLRRKQDQVERLRANGAI